MQIDTKGSEDFPALSDILAAIGASDHDRASELARAELERGTLHPLLLNLRAWWHEKQGRPQLAHTDLEHAHALAPEDVPVLNALGLSLARAGRTREALQSFLRATELSPEFAAAHYNCGWVSEELGDLDAARMHYERALQLGQNTSGNLAALAARQGNWASARLHAGQALAIDPGLAIAEHALASVEIAEGNYSDAEGRLTRMGANTSLSPLHLANTLSLLGDALDAAGRYGEAFAAYQSGNAKTRQVYAARFENPAVENMRQYVERLSRYFRNIPAESWMAADTDPPGDREGPLRHIFLLSFARSGTTLLEEVLVCQENVVTTQERDGLADGVAGLLKNEAGLDLLTALRGGGLARYRRAYWRKLADFGIVPEGRYVIDKQPYNTIGLPLIAKLFPAAKILFVVRDPRDVVLSCFRRRFLMNATNFQLLTLEGAAKFYDAVMGLAEICREKLPLQLREIRYEGLVANFEKEMRQICDYTGIAWTDRMNDFAGNAARRSITTPSAIQIARGLNREGIGHWRRYRLQLEPVLPILRPWIERFGYAAE